MSPVAGLDFPGGASGKEPACQCRRHKEHRFHSWVGKIPWRRAWLPTLVFLPGESQGQRNLAGYSPWSRKESDMTEQLTLVCSILFLLLLLLLLLLSRFSCVRLCDPIDGSPPGFPVSGIFQARMLEWVVISFCNA